MSILSRLFKEYEPEALHELPREKVYVLDERNNVMELEVKEDAEDDKEK